MKDIIDLSKCHMGYRDYGGSDRKDSIVYNGENYMLKFPQRQKASNPLQTSSVNNVLSEYIGSHIVASTKIATHETYLVPVDGSIAVACKDFVGEGERLQEFSWFMRSAYSSDEIGRIPTYNQIYDIMANNPRLKSITKVAIDRYWDTFVADALIGNFDRHKGNWGYLTNEHLKTIRPAPVYDCGSCLYPNLSEDAMLEIIGSREEIDKRLYEFPKAALNKNKNPKKINHTFWDC